MNATDAEITTNIESDPDVSQDIWPSFHEKSLLEAAVREAVRELQVHREMAIMCAFGAMTTACQGHVDVEMPTGHKVPTSLMLLTIADSGERKTTTQNYFFKAINVQNDVAYKANHEALAEYKVQHHLWGTLKRQLERTYSKCASQQDDSVTLAARDAVAEHVRTEPQPERSGKFLYEDTTPQALVQMLYENTPNGCLLTSEANSIFSGKALGELDKLNTLWDGGNVIVDRVSRAGFILQNARLTLSLMAQPSVIARFMGKRGEEARGTGFLARFLVVKPRQMAGQRSPVKLSALPRQQAFNARIHERLTSAVKPDRQILRFSESAADLWLQYSRGLEQQMQENGLYYYLKDHASKLLENTSRLAAILHTFERDLDSDTEIDHLTLQFCWKLAQICSKHFIEHLANEPQLVTDANNLAHYLLQKAIKESPVEQERRTVRENDASPARGSANTPRPRDLKPGVKTHFTLTQVKQYGPSTLRGRASAERLEATIKLLIQLGHIVKEGSRYHFQETVLLNREPEVKNGEILTIKELPLFSEQEYWKPERRDRWVDVSGYFIKIRT
ncbi:YfjI family protein [Pseudomonas sp. C32]|uniref:YfjI family protein n=1 Tax=Pseudomonas sp. C32 TaxID=1529208 RepID=UPI002635692F|nr:YfjI family protein [Pseudomonas sp. C32]MDN4546365.1 YfjI family protein [Pseudomonas sp. C32]